MEENRYKKIDNFSDCRFILKDGNEWKEVKMNR